MSSTQAAVVLGASGSVGNALVKELIRNGAFTPIVSLVRRSQPEQVAMARNAGVDLRETLVPAMDAAGLETATREALGSLEGDVVGFSVLGVGAGTAKLTLDAHRAVDVQLNAAFARGLKASGRVKHLAFMSAVGADPTAAATGSGAAGMARYARVKGEAEEAVKENGPAVVSVFRPGMIIGSQHTPWLLEKVLPLFSFVTPAKYRSITVEQIAKAMIATSLNTPAKSDVYHYPEMMALIGEGAGMAPGGARWQNLPMTEVTAATLPLSSGGVIPQLGLGVWQTPAGATGRQAVVEALRVGYRHVDTARIYGNEADVGAGIRASGLAREQVFVTTKLWNDDQGYDRALRAFDASLKRLGLDYVDLYLLHWPVAGKRLDSWRALERLYEEKRARAIGVSNFLVPHLEELLGAAKHGPAVNQIELTPFLQRRDTTAFCRQHGIVVEAYSPLTHGRRLGHPVLAEIARRVGRTVAQVLLRWSVQHGNVVLPKSTRPSRIAENARIFDFTLDERAMAELDALEEGLVTGWDPADQR